MSAHRGSWNEEDDSIVVVAPAYVRQFIEAIERTFKEIQSKWRGLEGW